MWSFVLICGLLACSWTGAQADGKTCTLAAKGSPEFPANFTFGASTAAYQIEGAWDIDGRGPSIWDDFTHDHPDKMADHSTGDVAADSYHRFDEDLQALKDLKVDFYRFSISWTRIFPNGDPSSRNQKGIDYYNDVINKLLANGIEPMVTMSHYDLPSEIQKIGGFANPVMIDQFVTYAIELFEIYGDRVKTWITFNEPFEYCQQGYGKAAYPPVVHAPGVADYLCIDTTIKAHAAAYHAYRSKFYEKQRGRIGMSLSTKFYYSKTNDVDLVHRGMHYNFGWLAQPIYGKSGGYPEVMVKDIYENSIKEGRVRSRLPEMSEKWKETIRGTGDFLGLNYYTGRYIEWANPITAEKPSWEYDFACNKPADPEWIMGKSDWFYCIPEGLEDHLKYIRDEYDNVEVIVTENGWSDDGELVDDNRIRYLKSHLQAVLNAINDGCNVSGYSHWSLIDNFEWLGGYTERFGLYSVNMSSPNRERTPKKSADYYKKVIETKRIPN